MSTGFAIVFVGVFVGLFILRLIVATIFFLWILPEADRCPICDSRTLRMRHRFWNAVLPRMRVSWCIDCGWEGLLRPGPRLDEPIYIVRRGPIVRATRKR